MKASLRVASPARLVGLCDSYLKLSAKVMRICVGILYLWFGVLKLVGNLSPVDQIATRTMSVMTFHVVPPNVSLPLLAALEMLIGIGLISGVFLRLTLIMFFVHMAGVSTALVLVPAEVWNAPGAPTLTGQYILKNIVLIACCLHVAAVEFGRTDQVVEIVEQTRHLIAEEVAEASRTGTRLSTPGNYDQTADAVDEDG